MREIIPPPPETRPTINVENISPSLWCLCGRCGSHFYGRNKEECMWLFKNHPCWMVRESRLEIVGLEIT
jgi:hypothetical protein